MNDKIISIYEITNKIRMDIAEINFNSKSMTYYELSNFYGGVESKYMADRFLDEKVLDLFVHFEECDRETFVEYLKRLQPNKAWTDSKVNYWMRNGEPIRGILSQLVGTSVRNTATGKRRRKVIQEITGVSSEIQIKENSSDDDKKKLMRGLLREKYSKKEYADVLLSTGTAILHERPLRGQPNNWTFKDGKGGDWLGELLTKVRDELRGDR